MRREARRIFVRKQKSKVNTTLPVHLSKDDPKQREVAIRKQTFFHEIRSKSKKVNEKN